MIPMNNNGDRIWIKIEKFKKEKENYLFILN